jgi:HD domain
VGKAARRRRDAARQGDAPPPGVIPFQLIVRDLHDEADRRSHERIDGSGYPYGLKGRDVVPGA